MERAMKMATMTAMTRANSMGFPGVVEGGEACGGVDASDGGDDQAAAQHLDDALRPGAGALAGLQLHGPLCAAVMRGGAAVGLPVRHLHGLAQVQVHVGVLAGGAVLGVVLAPNRAARAPVARPAASSKR